MSIDIDVQYAVSDGSGEPPGPELIRTWARAALSGRRDEAELTVRIVDAGEIQQLNRDYRHQDKPTNVLSFPFEATGRVELPLLGDVVICAAVVTREAQEQGKDVQAHWAHMVVHGVLHLLGYDHMDAQQADEMEALEIEILQQFGISDPYLEHDPQQAAN